MVKPNDEMDWSAGKPEIKPEIKVKRPIRREPVQRRLIRKKLVQKRKVVPRRNQFITGTLAFFFIVIFFALVAVEDIVVEDDTDNECTDIIDIWVLPHGITDYDNESDIENNSYASNEIPADTPFDIVIKVRFNSSCVYPQRYVMDCPEIGLEGKGMFSFYNNTIWVAENLTIARGQVITTIFNLEAYH